MLIGDARVSTAGQDHALQLDALKRIHPATDEGLLVAFVHPKGAKPASARSRHMSNVRFCNMRARKRTGRNPPTAEARTDDFTHMCDCPGNSFRRN